MMLSGLEALYHALQILTTDALRRVFDVKNIGERRELLLVKIGQILIDCALVNESPSAFVNVR